MNNLANKKNVIVTLFETGNIYTFDRTITDDIPSPTFQGTLNDFLKENDNLDSDEMKAIDQLKVDQLAFLSSGQGYMVLRRYR